MTFMLKVCNRASFFLNCFFNFLGFLYIFYFLIGVQLFYNVVLVFAVQQCESAMVGWWFYSLSHVWLLWPHGLQPARLLCPRDSLGKNTGVVCHFLLQGIFLIQGSNLIGESAICICISPPSWASLPPHPRLTSLGHHWASSWFPAVTVCSDFGVQENEICHCFPIYFPWSDGTGCHDLQFLNVEL